MYDPDAFFARTGLRLTDPETLDASAITPEMAECWAAPRRGRTNPERLNNPLWEWLVRTGVSAASARERFRPSSANAVPHWCFDRLGQPMVTLPDGRFVLIAGEHEDHYRPDFFIYNDVVVWHPDGQIDIYGYPDSEFPPTDSHTATLVDDRIVLIGTLGYPDRSKAGVTQVAVLDLATFSVRLQRTEGLGPGWLYAHTAEIDGDGQSIVVRGGMIDPGPDRGAPHHENFDEWRLWLDGWRWERLTDHGWRQFEVRRVDAMPLPPLWELGMLVRQEASGDAGEVLDPSIEKLLDVDTRRIFDEIRQHNQQKEDAAKNEEESLRKRGINTDRALFASLFHPDLPFTPEPSREADEFGTTRLQVQGVPVRYVDTGFEIRMVVEGSLPEPVLAKLVEDLRGKLEAIVGAACEVAPLGVAG